MSLQSFTALGVFFNSQKSSCSYIIVLSHYKDDIDISPKYMCNRVKLCSATTFNMTTLLQGTPLILGPKHTSEVLYNFIKDCHIFWTLVADVALLMRFHCNNQYQPSILHLQCAGVCRNAKNNKSSSSCIFYKFLSLCFLFCLNFCCESI